MKKTTKADIKINSRDIKEGVHLVWKELGETPAEVVERFKKENIEYDFLPVTYAGRLDPMAEGLLLLLSGNEVHNKEKYLGLSKKYKFEILWGFDTDTHDVLGVVSSDEVLGSNETPKEKDVEDYLIKSVGKFEQLYPMYSSRPVGGKPLFEWAREGKIGGLEIPLHDVEIFGVKFLDRRETTPKEVLDEILDKVSLVKGDFRQNEIKEKWKKVLSGINKLTIDSIEIDVSSGFYIRQFVSDLSKNLGSYGTTYGIIREKIGQYEI